MTSPFEIDPDIRRARTLASDFYTDPRYFEHSKEKIFARSWHFMGHVAETRALRPAFLLPGFLDEPVLLVRQGEAVGCLSNVCTHRAKLLIQDPCDADLIRCSYHGRRFSLDGKMISMPEFAEVEDFPSESDDLSRLECSELGGFVFVTIRPAAVFGDFIGDSAALFQDVEQQSLKLTQTREYQVNAHWALYCENYLEGFHIPYVHRALNEIVDYGTYRTDLFRYSSLQTGFGRDGNVEARYLFIFPNLMFNIYPWGISVNVVRPVAPARSVVEFMTYVRDETRMGRGAGADLHSVELEDEAVVESVQKGVRSRFYRSGRYSPTREQGTHHFHRLISEFMKTP
jgi:choline monooxygenase